MRVNALVILAALLVASCTIRQEFSFEEDFSGQYKVDVDMSSMASLTDGKAEPLLDSFNKDSMIEAMNNPSGLSQAFIEEKDHVISFGYHFHDVKSLNGAQKDADWGAIMGEGFRVLESEKPMFALKGKKLFYSPPKFDNNNSEVEETEGMEGMSSMIRYEVVLHFKKPIKKVSNENWVLTGDRKTAKFSVGLDELQKGNNGATQIKF